MEFNFGCAYSPICPSFHSHNLLNDAKVSWPPHHTPPPSPADRTPARPRSARAGALAALRGAPLRSTPGARVRCVRPLRLEAQKGLGSKRWPFRWLSKRSFIQWTVRSRAQEHTLKRTSTQVVRPCLVLNIFNLLHLLWMTQPGIISWRTAKKVIGCSPGAPHGRGSPNWALFAARLLSMPSPIRTLLHRTLHHNRWGSTFKEALED